jgi:hypothetical protein
MQDQGEDVEFSSNLEQHDQSQPTRQACQRTLTSTSDQFDPITRFSGTKLDLPCKGNQISFPATGPEREGK